MIVDLGLVTLSLGVDYGKYITAGPVRWEIESRTEDEIFLKDLYGISARLERFETKDPKYSYKWRMFIGEEDD